MCVCVLVVQGRVLSWGRADYGQLGLAETAEAQPVATSRSPNFVPTPSEIVGLGRICQVLHHLTVSSHLLMVSCVPL